MLWSAKVRALLVLAVASLPCALAACGGDGAAPNPFDIGEAGAGGEAGAAPVPTGTSPLPTDPGIGGPCADSAECDDQLDCTDDICEPTLARCLFTPVHSRCTDDVYCNGAELCRPGSGCRPGPPVSCSDDSSCTIDVCIEATRSCESTPRDADGDGDPVRNCGGGDCLDTDASVSSLAVEICGNSRDDDCDGAIDDSTCVEPEYDSCADPLLIDASGSYELSLLAARRDFASSCTDGASFRDVVVALVVPDDATDVDVTAVSDGGIPALSLAGSCSDPSTELTCTSGEAFGSGNFGVARTRLRGLPAETHPLIVSLSTAGHVTLDVRYREAEPRPENESCELATELLPDRNELVLTADSAPNLDSACRSEVRDLVYYFELDALSDVEVHAVSLDDYGVPLISLRDAACAPLESELACRQGTPASLFARALAPGTYYLMVGSIGASEIDVRLTLRAPTSPPDNEGCSEPRVLDAGETLNVDLGRSADAVNPECLPGAPDATYLLELDQPSDVLLALRLSDGDVGAVSLAGADCSRDDRLVCALGEQSPIRAIADAVPAGSHRVVAESALGAPVALTAFTRPAQTAVLVGFADTCDDAVVIPEEGGRFLGNTANAEADYEASCDFGSGFPGGAPEQMLSLHLERERRVVFDLSQSAYSTMLVVREASSCPGPEVLRTCVPGYVEGRSFLDRVLPAGDYWVQIDGYDRTFGNWILDVFVVDP